ncbi:recombinase family protein [Rhizobium sp. WL3]|nr:recombinase family protein [Rhizobium sp. WL3]
MRPDIIPIRAFLYARSATEVHISPIAKVDEQLQRLRQHAQKLSYVVVGEARDAAKSGKSLSRTGLTSVLRQAACFPATFDVLLTVDRSRLARGIVIFETIASRLTAAGIRIEFADEVPTFGDETTGQERRAGNVPMTNNPEHRRPS